MASDPTVSRGIDDLAAGGQQVLDALAAAHATARARVHAAGGGPRTAGLVSLDIDATLITAHSEVSRGLGVAAVAAFTAAG